MVSTHFQKVITCFLMVSTHFQKVITCFLMVSTHFQKVITCFLMVSMHFQKVITCFLRVSMHYQKIIMNFKIQSLGFSKFLSSTISVINNQSFRKTLPWLPYSNHKNISSKDYQSQGKKSVYFLKKNSSSTESVNYI